jgi:methylphosphotriester-DNA--protein-cysteine methyltransferase
MSPGCKTSVKFIRLSKGMRRFFAGAYLLEIEVDGDGFIEDFLYPDWATLRFTPQSPGNTEGGGAIGNCRFFVSGPRTRETYIRTGTVRQWVLMIHPPGWASLIGEPADHYANRLIDGMTDPAFEKFCRLAGTLFGSQPDPEGEQERLTSFCETLEPLDDPAAETIEKVFLALYDSETETVKRLAEKAGVSRRTVERLCRRAFGFAPKTVLRRQRFVRSLAHFTVDPSLRWVGAMDAAYHDQAQFVRDFHEFMGMTPTRYSQLAKPVVGPVIRERMRELEALMRDKGADRAA